MVEREITLEQMLFSGQDNALLNDHTWLAPKLFKVRDVRKRSVDFFSFFLHSFESGDVTTWQKLHCVHI